MGQRIVRGAYGDAGMGVGRSMLICNGRDTRLKVTRHESELTSDWCSIAREYEESTI
ncbi:MAG TPA: hypothetical protein PLY23_01385 [Alphaproteobacteria bacterium]|nr:hypothetical protein [Alphaproteobacteria bacterium]HQS93350.1 hypothetical protein [Alphaproteobacteria bacterium]